MLSLVEQTIIQQTWEKISRDLKGNGAKVFLRFFRDYPSHQKAFRSFANVPLEELAGHKRFQAHAFTVMNAVDGMVNSLDDPEMLEEMLLRTGANHGRRKIVSKTFEEFKSSFMGFLETSLNEQWSSEVENAWIIVSSAIINKIIEGLDSDE